MKKSTRLGLIFFVFREEEIIVGKIIATGFWTSRSACGTSTEWNVRYPATGRGAAPTGLGFFLF
ncbi:MAG: hypothetical protein U0Y08_06765 [Bacteroidia bacterium]